MRTDDSVFAVKLYEMEEQYGKLGAASLPVNGAGVSGSGRC